MANHHISKESLRASGQVQSLSRALRLMNTLADNPQGLSLSEVAHGVGLPTSTAHRLLTTLQNERYVRFDAERSNWLIGVQAFRVGAAFMRSRDIIATARPYMRRLMEVSGETVNLGIIDRGEVVYLAQVETQKMMRAMTGPGGRSDILTSSVGRAILSFMRQDECEKLINSLHFQPGVAQLPKARGVLQSDLQATRVRGYSIDNEENSVGLRCVASVIFDEHSEPLAGVSVSGPTARVSEARIASLGETVAAIASEITTELGGTLPDRKSA
ncbi:MAG: IclR family transcriptional regulator [Hyphomicrobiales bacterium]